MTKIKFDKSLCENCGRPLFPTAEECRSFIEKKMKDGYIICSCCGTQQKMKQAENQ